MYRTYFATTNSNNSRSSATAAAGPKLHTVVVSCVVLVLAVGTSRAACAAAAAAAAAAATACYTARCYCIPYAVHICEYDVLLLLAIHIPERLGAAWHFLWSFVTKCKTCQEM